MASIWSLDGNDIYVDQDSEEHKAVIAELNPINSTESIFHELFEPTATKNIVGTVIGETFLGNILGTKGSTVSLVSDLVLGGDSVYVQDVKYERVHVFKQTVDQSQSETAPVYRVTVTLRPQ